MEEEKIQHEGAYTFEDFSFYASLMKKNFFFLLFKFRLLVFGAWECINEKRKKNVYYLRIVSLASVYNKVFFFCDD